MKKQIMERIITVYNSKVYKSHTVFGFLRDCGRVTGILKSINPDIADPLFT